MLSQKDAKKKTRDHKKEFLRYTRANAKTLPKDFASWIDPQIRNAVVELNKQGYKTILSCAGHLQPGATPRIIKQRRIESGIIKDQWYSEGNGYIILHRSGYNKERVFSILKAHRLSGIKQHFGIIFDIPCVLVTFNHVGSKPRIKDEIGSGIMIEAV